MTADRSSERQADAAPAAADPGAGPTAPSLGYWFYALHLVTVWGLALSNAFLGLVGLWSAARWRRIAGTVAARSPVLVPLVFYALFLALAVVSSKDPARSAPELKELLSLASLPLGLLLVRGEQAVRRIVGLLIVMTALLGVFGILQFALTEYGPLDNRIRGPFSHYMTFSGVMLLGGSLLLAKVIERRDRRRLLEWSMLAVIFLALFLTLTRGAWLAAATTGSLALVLFAPRVVRVYLGAGFVVALLVFVLSPGPWTERMRSIADPSNPSNYDRLCMIEAGLGMVEERPLFGIGPRMVDELYPIYRNPTAPRHRVSHLHNTFVHLAAERGLLSLGAYIWLMALGALEALRGYRRGTAGDLHLGVLLSLLAFNVAGLFEANWRDTEVQRLLLFVLAMPFILERSRPSEVPVPDGSPD